VAEGERVKLRAGTCSGLGRRRGLDSQCERGR
jgi:hypothetical protein